MKPRNNQSSFSKKNPDTYSTRPSKTQLDYYDNYPHLVPPYAYNGFMNPYPGMLPYAPYAQIAAAMQAGMFAPGLMPPGMMGYPHKKKFKNQPLAPIYCDPAYLALQTDGKQCDFNNLWLKKIICFQNLY